MKLLVERKWKKAGYTIGVLSINGVRFCDTLEDVDRGLFKGMLESRIKAIKVPDETAIPIGTYAFTISLQSPKFSAYKYRSQYGFCNGYLPRLLGVPGFQGVLIHAGSNAGHTSGCILVGKNTVKGGLTQSTTTFQALYKKIQEAEKHGETLSIEIR